jgi:hypothetical protein
MKKNSSYILILILFFTGIGLSSGKNKIFQDEEKDQKLLSYFDNICQWIVEIDVGSGELNIEAKRKTSIFINSNLARILVAGYELTGKEEYLSEAFDWFDRLVDLQQDVKSSNNMDAGWWGDFTPNDNIYLGDAGTSATALSGIVRFAENERKNKYLKALEKYANFVNFGSKNDPQKKGRKAADSFIVQAGEHSGAIGCGYYKNELSVAPYIVSTSVTGSAFFSSYYVLTSEKKYLNIAKAATRWMLRQRDPFGEMPYMLHNFSLDDWPLDTMTYVADGIVSAYLRSNDDDFKKEIVSSMNRSIQWLLNSQNRYGTWGTLRSEDQQRSQGVVNLLVWYYNNISPNVYVKNSIQKNCLYFLDEENSKKFGVMELPITTGFVGLGIAEVLEPGITYRVK